MIHHVETPGTKLHTAWANLDAPVLAKGYYKVRAHLRGEETGPGIH